MILLYHKIDLEAKTVWWVDVDSFYRQMLDLKSKKVVYLDDYDPDDEEQVVITFDGVYENVYKYAVPILERFGYPYELFVIGNFIGKISDYDKDEPETMFANSKQLSQMVKTGGRLQWHSQTHPHFTDQLSDRDLERELEITDSIRKIDKKGFGWFGYPHGEFNDEIIDKVKEVCKKGAVSVIQGNDQDKYKLNRVVAKNDSRFNDNTIGVIIPSYNYGRFLIEAVESVLKQTRLPDKILISDDASSDNTWEIGEAYAKKYPDLITFNRNDKNLGIIDHFNKAVSLLKTDYICFLGADNRFRSDYIEKTSLALDTNEDISIVYTDFALFDKRAPSVYEDLPKPWRGKILEKYYYIINFPDFNDNTKESFLKRNFMHGSSMYRYKAYKKVGGYMKKKDMPEDHSLFKRIIKDGWGAVRIPEPVLEYRQHSDEQANIKMATQAELNFYRSRTRQLEVAEEELTKIKSSKFWKLLNIYKNPKTALPHYFKKLIIKVIEKMWARLLILKEKTDRHLYS